MRRNVRPSVRVRVCMITRAHCACMQLIFKKKNQSKGGGKHGLYAAIFWDAPSKVEVSQGVKERGAKTQDKNMDEPAPPPVASPLFHSFCIGDKP